MAPTKSFAQLLLSGAPVALLATSVDGQIEAANDAAEELFGVTAAALIGQQLDVLLPADSGSEVMARRADGSRFAVSTEQSSFDVDGSPHFAIAVFAQAPAEPRELAAYRRRLDYLAEFSRTFAHDVNNVLGIVLNFSWLLAKRSNDPDTIEALEEIRHAAERAVALTGQLLVISPHGMRAAASTDLHSVTEESASIAAQTWDPQLRLHLDLAGEPVFVEADHLQLERIVTGLLRNAEEANRDGGTVKISSAIVEGTTKTRAVELTVTDNGSGMSRDDVGRAFDPAFTTKEGERTAGLGLSTVRHIVEQYGGQVVVHSVLGRCTSVKVTLPLVERPVLDG